jgi:hypothetical protein
MSRPWPEISPTALKAALQGALKARLRLGAPFLHQGPRWACGKSSGKKTWRGQGLLSSGTQASGTASSFALKVRTRFGA